MIITEMEVRDYECDLQGIVNNANYMNYLEHGRHQVLKEHKVNFAKLSADAKDLVVTEAQLKYHQSLIPGDKFTVETEMVLKSKIRLSFQQRIKVGDTLCLEAEVTGVCVDRNLQKVIPIQDVIDI